MPAFALLGGIELIRGDAVTGWTYIVAGAILTVTAAIVVSARERGRVQFVRTRESDQVQAIASAV